MLNKEKQYSYNDVVIKPAIISEISSRSECNPYFKNNTLPLFTAPMNTVVDETCADIFEINGITPILPRTVDFNIRLKAVRDNKKWAAFSLQEFEDNFVKKEQTSSDTMFVLIDIANGHMKKLLETVSLAKDRYENRIKIMAGNVANSQTYLEYAKVGVDYIRVGIGVGSGCITTTQTGISGGIVTLIDEMKQLKDKVETSKVISDASLGPEEFASVPYIVADGGIRGYSDVIKALALGADFVMVGGLFSQFLESAGPKYFKMGAKIPLRVPLERYQDLEYNEKNGWTGLYTDDYYNSLRGTYTKDNMPDRNERKIIGEIYKRFYGMASRQGQIAMNGVKTKTSEGTMKDVKVKYLMKGWVTNMTDYLKSAMSYTNSKTLAEFRKNAEVVIISENTKNSINQ